MILYSYLCPFMSTKRLGHMEQEPIPATPLTFFGNWCFPVFSVTQIKCEKLHFGSQETGRQVHCRMQDGEVLQGDYINCLEQGDGIV